MMKRIFGRVGWRLSAAAACEVASATKIPKVAAKRDRFKKRGERSADSFVRANLALSKEPRGQGCPRSVLESGRSFKYWAVFFIRRIHSNYHKTIRVSNWSALPA